MTTTTVRPERAGPSRRSRARPTATVPAAAALAAGLEPARWHHALVAVGRRWELDLAAVAPADVQRLAEMLRRARALWSAPVLGAGVDIVVPLVDRRARDLRSGPRTRDALSVELDALDAIPGAGPLGTALTAPTPDLDTLRRLGVGCAGELTIDGIRGTWHSHHHPRGWPAALGGAPSPGEVARLLDVRVSWASWRDRRARRLVAVRSAAIQRWPRPLDA